jgi:hypothetical protein
MQTYDNWSKGSRPFFKDNESLSFTYKERYFAIIIEKPILGIETGCENRIRFYKDKRMAKDLIKPLFFYFSRKFGDKLCLLPGFTLGL